METGRKGRETGEKEGRKEKGKNKGEGERIGKKGERREGKGERRKGGRWEKVTPLSAPSSHAIHVQSFMVISLI